MIQPDAIQAFSDALVERYHPERILLFGSYADGKATPDSDVDLLVVINHVGQAQRLAAEMVARLRPPFPVDLLVRNSEAIKYRIGLGDPFLLEIWKNGKVLHEAT